MIEPFLALTVTVVALGSIAWRLRHHKARNSTRLVLVILLMVLIALAVQRFVPEEYGFRVQLWFGPLTAVLMAVATYVETEPKKP